MHTDDSERARSTRAGTPGHPVHEASPLRAAEHERDAAEASRDRFAFLAEVSRCLADSLDYETTLTTVAGMSLPYLGAWCIVDLVADDGAVRRLAVLHPDAAKQALARELHERYPPRPDDLIGAPRVIRTGRPELVFDVPDAALATLARDATQLALLRALGTRAYIIVPMVARGRTLGAMTFVTADDARRFGDIDVVIAEDLARRAAMAVDNARLHRDALQARAQAETAATQAEAATEEAEAATEEALSSTEQARLAHESAEEALAARGRFVSTMSHEFRTPINAMIGYAQLLELGVAGPLTDQQRDFVARLTATSEHLRALVDDVLDLSRLDGESMTVARERGFTAPLVATALDLVRPQACARGIRLVDPGTSPEGEPFVGDEHRVRQILANLLTNAVKFTAPGGTVTVACGRTDPAAPPAELRGAGPWTFVRVADTGIGIAAAEHERIFAPFHQVHDGHTRQAGGTGLGLAISRRLARLMGGDLTVQSAPGDGAAFTLWLGNDASTASVVVEPGDRASEGASLAGLAAVGVRLRAESEAVLAGVGARLRADPIIGRPPPLRRSELEDHQLSLIADIAQTLIVIDETGALDSDLLRDGTTIQRVVAELHGAMRWRRGWTEAQVAREYAILGEELAAAVGRHAPTQGHDPAALDIVGRLVERASATALATMRREPGHASRRLP